MATSTVLVEQITPRIVKITLNRPKSLNALNVDLLSNLVNALRQHSKAQIIILEGAGERSFCAGEDLKQTLAPKTGTAEELRESFELLQDITRLTSSSSAIVISAVQGFAIGGGAEIALAADFVIGGPAAKFKFPEASIGHAVTGGISLRLVQMVGLLKAKELFLLGNFVGAEEALKIGLLSEVVDDPKAGALELALSLEKMPRVASSSSKSSLERAVFPNMESVLADEINVASHCFAQSDAAKAFSDFQKRKADGMPNGTKETIPEDLNTALQLAVDKWPSRPFLRFSGIDYSFNDFDQAVAHVAGMFQEYGVTQGDKVVVMMRNSPQMVQVWFASNRLGAVFAPINSELKSVTLKHVVESAEGKIAVVDTEFYQSMTDTQCFHESSIIQNNSDNAFDCNAKFRSAKPVVQHCTVYPSTVSAYLYTSGTTGRSKPCVLSHQYFITQAFNLVRPFSITGSDVLYCPFPMTHADATALTIVPSILTGATAALSKRFSVRNFWTEIRQTKATIYDFMGATLALIYKQEPSDQDRNHNVRLAWGVPVPTWAEKYEARFGHPIKEVYGSVESGLPVVQQGPRVLGSCGSILPGYRVMIADENDNPVPADTPGRLLLRSEQPNSMFQGYFKCPEQTLAATANLWLHTGDLAKMDEKGNIYFLGREKDLIRRRGENVNAFEIEEELLRHPEVVTAAAFAVPSALGKDTEDDVKVAVVVRKGSVEANGFSEKILWEWCQANMARFQVPSVIEFVETLKKTPTGKIDKRELKKEGGIVFDLRRAVST